MAFLPIRPATRGHTLVVPREHFRDFLDLDDSTAQELSPVITRVGLAVRQAMAPEGMNLITSSGAAATQSIFHLHYHLVPRWEDDAIVDFWPLKSAVPDSELEALALDIAALIPSNI